MRAADDINVYSKDERDLRKHLALLTSHVRLFESQVDILFHPTSPVQGIERGKKLAAHLNDLVLTNDKALYFGLGFDYRSDSKEKRKDGTNIKAIIKHGAKTRKVKP